MYLSIDILERVMSSMLKIVILVVIFAGIVYFEVPKLVRANARAELWAFSIILLIGFGLSVSLALGFVFPIPPLPQL